MEHKPLIGINPIVWSVDDFDDLRRDKDTLEKYIESIAGLGYQGTEMGHWLKEGSYEDNLGLLKGLLDKNNIRLISGWHSTFLLENDYEHEKDKFIKHLDFLKYMGSEVVIIAECSGSVYQDKNKRLTPKLKLNDNQFSLLALKLESLAELAQDYGIRLAYHHHMGTVVQDWDDIERLMEKTELVSLLLDTGHARFAKIGEPIMLLDTYHQRIAHVHFKNVRIDTLRQAIEDNWSFYRAVKEGVFTVPGDERGCIDFLEIFDALQARGYNGWVVVEAEQNPNIADPLDYSRKAIEYVKGLIT